MNDVDMQRIQGIVERVLRAKAEATLQAMKEISPLTQLEVELYNTVMREYPELDANIQPHIRTMIRVNPSDPLDIEVVVERVETLSNFTVSV